MEKIGLKDTKQYEELEECIYELWTDAKWNSSGESFNHKKRCADRLYNLVEYCEELQNAYTDLLSYVELVKSHNNILKSKEEL